MSELNFKLYVDSRFISPYAMSAFVALTEKGIPFELQTVDLVADECRQPDYSKMSLTCRVPMLAHGDFYLSESSAIAEYLEDIFPSEKYPRLYPENIRDKARARQIQAWLRSDLMPIREERPTEVIFCEPVKKALSVPAQDAVAALFAALDDLIGTEALNLFGEWSIVDTDLALMINRLVMNGDTVSDKFSAYARHQWQRESVQQWVNKIECR